MGAGILRIPSGYFFGTPGGDGGVPHGGTRHTPAGSRRRMSHSLG